MKKLSGVTITSQHTNYSEPHLNDGKTYFTKKQTYSRHFSNRFTIYNTHSAKSSRVGNVSINGILIRY